MTDEEKARSFIEMLNAMNASKSNKTYYEQLVDATKQLHELYQSLIDGGFSKDEAISLMAAIIVSMN